MFQQRIYLLLTLGLVLSGLILALTPIAVAQGPVNWHHATAPPGAYVSTFATHPTDPNRLWAATLGDYMGSFTYLYRSDDGGSSWDLMGGGLPDACNWDRGARYVVDVHADGRMVALGCGTVYLSDDDGMTWEAVRQDGDVRQVVIAPSDADVFYALIYNEGVFRSTDGGASWHFAGSGLPNDGGELTLHPADADTAYFKYVSYAGGEVTYCWWQTTDGGASWQELNTSDLPGDVHHLTVDPLNANVVYAEAEIADGDRIDLYRSIDGGTSWNPTPVITDVTDSPPVIAPGSPRIWYIARGRAQCCGLYRSTDGGVTWELWVDDAAHTPETVDWQDHNKLYRRGIVEVYVSDDGGRNWITATIPIYLESLVAHPDGGVVAGGYGNVYRSEDGLHYRAIDGALPPLRAVNALAVSPITPTTLYAGLDGQYFAGVDPAQLVWRSDDGSRTWAEAYTGLPITGSVASLLVDPLQPETVYVSLSDTEYGQSPPAFLYRSDDGGESWQRTDTGLPADEYIYDLIARPDGSVIYAGTRYGVYRSTDHGENWEAIGPNIADYVPGYSGYSIVDAMTLSGTTLYAGVCGCEGSGYNTHRVGCNIYYTDDEGQTWETGSGYADDVGATALIESAGNLYVSWIKSYWLGNVRVEELGGYLSTDGGQSWTALSLPCCTRRLWGPSADDRLYVSIKHGGLARSADGGQSWTGSSAGLEGSGADVTALAAYSDTVYAGSFWGVLFKSTDRGERWNVLAPGLGMCDVNVDEIVIHPADPERVYVGTSSIGASAAGLFRSEDGGATWERSSGVKVEDIAVLPHEADKVWVAAEYNGLLYSDNGGDDWAIIENTYLPVYSVAVNPRNPDVLLVGTTRIWLSDRSDYYCVFRSVDGGTTWDPVLGGSPPCLSDVATTVEFNAYDPDLAYADAYYSEDGGLTWTAGRETPRELNFDPGDPRRVYGLTADLVLDGLLQRSLDGGQTWSTPGWPAQGIDYFAVGWAASAPRLYALDADAPMRFWWALDNKPYSVFLPLVLKER